MKTFWDRVWEKGKVHDYRKYIDINRDYYFVDYFHKFNIKKVCDAACGFGKYSVLGSFNGFEMSGFDVSEKSIELTRNMLELFNLDYNNYKVCDITNIDFENNYFDGVIAHSVLDHLSAIEAKEALSELKRITKSKGLIYISFDRLEKEDLESPHKVLDDGSFKYTKGKRKGMIFKYYNDKDIKELLKSEEIILFKKYSNGVRDIMIKI